MTNSYYGANDFLDSRRCFWTERSRARISGQSPFSFKMVFKRAAFASAQSVVTALVASLLGDPAVAPCSWAPYTAGMVKFHFSLRWLLAIVGVFAVFFAAAKRGTVVWLQIAFLITFLAMLCTILGIIWSNGQKRAFLIGFLVFGGSYFLIVLSAFCGANAIRLLPSRAVLDVLQLFGSETQGYSITFGEMVIWPDRYIVHFGSSLLFGLVGGWIGSTIRNRARNSTESVRPAQ